MAGKGLKNRKPLGVAVSIELATALKQLSEETMIPQSKLTDKALELLLKEYGKEVAK